MSTNEFRAAPQYYPPAPRPLPPSVALTIVITLLFGIFGLIPAATGSSKAAALGYPTGKYWGAFFAVMACWFLLAVMIAAGA